MARLKLAEIALPKQRIIASRSFSRPVSDVAKCKRRSPIVSPAPLAILAANYHLADDRYFIHRISRTPYTAPLRIRTPAPSAHCPSRVKPAG